MSRTMIEQAAASLHTELAGRLGDQLVTVGYDERRRVLIVYVRGKTVGVDSPYRTFRVETHTCGRVRPARGK